MSVSRFFCALFVVVALFAAGCEMVSNDNGPTPVCVNVAGVRDPNMVGGTGTGIVCPDRSLVWTVHQSDCDVTIESREWDPANGATGGITDNHLYVAWSCLEGCYRYSESIDVVVDSKTMTGTYGLFRSQAVYPADWGSGSATLRSAASAGRPERDGARQLVRRRARSSNDRFPC